MIGATLRNPQTQKSEQFSNQVQYPQILRAQAGDRRTEDRFIRKNQRLVFKEAQRYRGLADWDDLVAAGNWGLARAIQKFDVSKGFKFSSYALKPIRTEIQQFLNDERGLSKEIARHLKVIKQASQDLEWELERKPTLEKLSERTGYSQRIITNTWDRARVVETSSLNIPVGENLKAEQLDLVEGSDNLWDYAENIDEKEYITQLPERYNVIVRARRDGHSYRTIGRMLGLSGERIRQLFKEALAYLKHLVTYGACLVRFPQPIQAKEPEEVAKSVIKRVDASRLGGRIGRTIKRIFNRTQEEFINEPGELTHAQKHILVFRRRSNHGAADVARHRLTPENQRCRQLERTQDDWRGYLGFSQVILSIIFLPLVLVCQTIRGFQDNDRPITRRSIMSSITTGASKVIGIGYRKEHPRPPNDLPDTDENLP
ncbi:sigma-70 family RNA polymerase sigma factor (plasmid) [Acaryochloris sp. 'Moss Beach']|uniref:sigma-70 family RNA polymerase sigma factor n=1 Tax=Acaryochloris sp. 'Moss Beach' TaxID=2740837 RepID=UPI001F22B46C|nr:sigma-70 family RNA polymerase sigma factor [Acaryochloris sp. 'Moss Beach']UJB73367.1 sigma-70 family RNA polymerase sigma factor [Acaryochloris sp. 'Moss Beach']